VALGDMSDLVCQHTGKLALIFRFQDKLGMYADITRRASECVDGRRFDDEEMELVPGRIRVRCQSLSDTVQVIVNLQVIDEAQVGS